MYGIIAHRNEQIGIGAVLKFRGTNVHDIAAVPIVALVIPYLYY